MSGFLPDHSGAEVRVSPNFGPRRDGASPDRVVLHYTGMKTGAAAEARPEPGTTVTISGIGTNKSVTCNDNIVIISGANNTVDITGHCTAVTVSGFENVITADSTQEIAVSGFDNKVTYRTGDPRVSESGSGNSISQG